ncbi:hypothetical protein BMS_2779 [Halobacteriovorax marinus SJ]|uniref:Uncharacterized protein n=1 Tax=Halobacteriovorax marinus (strain ATCC BAA-682 / DSM 15412 / SJ) TaxID=862908 RepID=E1WY00_HALMS|nr:hypothetical protein [Halobacteriovorax marinus]CBW27555.1 hypothetical protein BMS_2779 [Halobacteriovorax marinus SJ]
MLTNIPDPENCKFKNEFNIQLVLAMAKSDFLLGEELKPFIKKCSPSFSERTLDILHYPYKKGNDLSDILLFLKSRGFEKDEMDKIEKIWNAKYSKDSELGEYRALLKQIKNEKSKLKKYSYFNKLLTLANKSKSVFLKRLILSASYGQIGNQGLLAKSFKELLAINEIIYTIDLTQNFVSFKNRDHYYSLVNDLFNLLRESLNDTKLIRILDTNFQFLDTKKEKIEFESDELSWSLNEIRENMNSSLYGISFPSFWMKSVINRISNSEKQKFITKLEKDRVLRKLNILDYWVFQENLSPNDTVRDFIVNQINKSYGDSYAGDYIILELLEDNIFKKNLGDINPELKKPIFTLKRNFYHQILEAGRESSFPILKLIEMGEEREEFIWWLIL